MKAARSFAGRGFSLIELMVAIAVLGILAALALPAYTEYINRGKRAAARQVLLQAAGELERRYSTNGCYNRTSASACFSQTGSDVALSFTRAPLDGTQTYAISVTFPTTTGGCSSNGQCFTVTATPCGTTGANCPTDSENFTDARCGSFTLDQAGTRTESGTDTLDYCWGR